MPSFNTYIAAALIDKMRLFTGYIWAVTGAAAAAAPLVVLPPMTYSPPETVAHVLETLFAVFLTCWIIAFMLAWPMYLGFVTWAKAHKVESFACFLAAGAATGLIIGAGLGYLAMGPWDNFDTPSWRDDLVTFVCCLAGGTICGANGASLFWWTTVRR